MQQNEGLYEPLSAKSIRLLSITPGFPSEPIECGLVTVQNVEEAPDYDAVSYVWGVETSPEPIFVNGVPMTVTKNLADALRLSSSVSRVGLCRDMA